ncbi:hypothetical protein [Nodosilinea nodulosa]|uniref:hypothetical protein n=1 Tax=Nodosilinea nodulosa TaxID=416001 RepID=UPI00031C4265|nr:hypothetical protein [Nodosilinea nodulosa]
MTPAAPRPRRARLTAPKAAAIAGIVFSGLFITSLVLFLAALPATTTTSEIFNAHRQTLSVGLNLVPFAGIAFLWFMGVVRDRLGSSEDQFFSTVFFGSGLLFIAMLFTGTAVMGSLLTLYASEPNPQIAASYYAIGRAFAQEITINYAIRAAGVFMISTATLFLRTGVLPRWLSFLGYGLALIMLFRVGHIEQLGWVVLFLPLWILLISVYVLIDNYRRKVQATL